LNRKSKRIPEKEQWLHQPKARRDLERAVAWAQQNPPRESALDAITEKLPAKPKRKRVS
jgi:hypothetical protein